MHRTFCPPFLIELCAVCIAVNLILLQSKFLPCDTFHVVKLNKKIDMYNMYALSRIPFSIELCTQY